MSYLKAVEADTLKLPSSTPENGYVVVMKKKVSYGDQSAAQSAALKVDPMNGSATVEWAPFIRALTVSMIVSWSLTDENDQPLPITIASLNQLTAEDGQFLASEASARAALRGETEQRPFGKPSPSPSTDLPPIIH